MFPNPLPTTRTAGPTRSPEVHPVSTIAASPVAAVDLDCAGPTLVLVQPDPIRVLIADAQPCVRAAFTAMLQGERDITVAGLAGDADEAIALASELRPDVALVALDLPGVGGLEAARRIHHDPDSADVNVMILAAHESDEDLLAALLAGALGFGRKGVEPAELVHVVRMLARGEAVLSPDATRRLIEAFRSRPARLVPAPEQLDELTAARERRHRHPQHAARRPHRSARRLTATPGD
jgi:DNA-binding NarL/FixJ family response regulator